jgi:hypothetical protein
MLESPKWVGWIHIKIFDIPESLILGMVEFDCLCMVKVMNCNFVPLMPFKGCPYLWIHVFTSIISISFQTHNILLSRKLLAHPIHNSWRSVG